MSRCLAACLALLTIAAADAGPLPHASGRPDGPGPRCGGGFTAARGDTLYSIARRCGVTVAELVDGNGLGHPPRLGAGQRIDLGIEVNTGPRDIGLPAPPPPPRGVVRPLPRMAPPRARPDRPAPPAPPPPSRIEGAIYHFQTGDTLYSLARWARVTLPALLAANPDVDPRDIEIGDPIRLPRGAARPEAMRMRERAPPASVAAVSPPPPLAALPIPPEPPRSPAVRPPPPPEAAKPAPDDEDEETPGGMDDGGSEPDGM